MELPSKAPRPASAPPLRKSLRLMPGFFRLAKRSQRRAAVVIVSGNRSMRARSRPTNTEEGGASAYEGFTRLLANLHIKGQNLFLRVRLPNHIASHTVDFG